MIYIKRTALVIFLIATIGSTVAIAPRPVHAAAPVITVPGSITSDPTNLTQNTITAGATAAALPFISSLSTAYQARKGPGGSGLSLDTIAWTVGKIAIQMMTKSIVNWINSGFSGAPSFITNFQGFLTNVADVAATSFISQLSSNGAMKSPFQSQVAQNTQKMYSQSSSQTGFFASIQYTLNKLIPGGNDAAFLAGNFSQGGWSAFYSASQFPQNNPIGSQLIASAQLRTQIGNAASQQTTKAGWGQGFLSWCGDASGGGGGAQQGGSCHTDDDCAGSLACVDAPEGHCAVDKTLDGTTAQTCTTKDGAQGTIQTPGSVIQSQVNKTLGLSGDTLVTADEFNEVIGALLSQLVSQVLGGLGLSGVASVSSGGSGYIDQAASTTQITNQQASSTEESDLANSINTEVTAIQQFQTDWQTIGTEAQAADSGAECVSNATDKASADTVLTQSQTGTAKAATALAALQKIANDATLALTGTGLGLSSGSTGLPDITQVSEEFQAFLSASSTPGATDITYAHAQAADNTGNTDDAPLTLFAQMEAIATKDVCSVTPGT